MTKFVFVSLFLLASGLLQAQDIKTTDARQFMQTAVLEFLTQNRFNHTGAKKISEDYSLFVGKCKICEGSRAGFVQYAAAPPNTEPIPAYSDTALFSADKETRLKALELLVNKAVAAAFKKHRFNKKQRKAMQAKLEAEKQRSSMMTNGRYCASCTGSCRKPE